MALPTSASQDLIVLVNLTSSMLPMTEYDTSQPNQSVSNASSGAGGCSSSNTMLVDHDDLKYFLNGIATAIVCALGVVGNFLSIIVLTRRTMKTSTNCFLSALAIWDTLVLLIALFLVGLPELSTAFYHKAFPYIVVYVYPVALCAQTATVWLTVSFTVERYIAVCHPLKAARMCNIPRARAVIVSIFIVSVLYNLPRWFEYSIDKNDGVIHIKPTSLGDHQIYNKIYFGWLYFLVMCFIPLCSLAVLNAFLIRAVGKSRQQRKDMNVRQSRENNVTIMLVFVVMTFIICQVPALIYNIAYAINKQNVQQSCGWEVLSHFRNFLVLLNSAVNFILYCALGQKFRRTFVRTLCPCFAKQVPSRFQSFSFHPHRDHDNEKSFNGNYSKVGYKPCRTDKGRKTLHLDMKVIVKPNNNSRDSSESNCSNGSPDQLSSTYQGSHKRLLTSSNKQ